MFINEKRKLLVVKKFLYLVKRVSIFDGFINLYFW